MSKADFIVEEASGIRVPADLAKNMADIDAIVPNPWNPNKMDAFMRERLDRAFTDDGFIVPILVRPSNRIDVDADWEIIDGEQRWTRGKERGMKQVPFVNLGPITDSQAKAITIKANTLKGEFDSVGLAEIIKELADESSLAAVSEALPYTPERLQGMIDLLGVDTDAFTLPTTTGDEDRDDEDGGRSSGSNDFKSFSPGDMEFAHQCPRCGFEFNDKEVN